MTNAQTPAENTGGSVAQPNDKADNTDSAGNPQNAQSTAGESAPGLPDRVRVHALAKLLGATSRDVLAELTKLGQPARSAQSSVPKDLALKVADGFGLRESLGGQWDAAGQDRQQGEETPDQGKQPPGTSGAETAGSEAGSAQAQSAAHMPVFAAPSPVFLPPEPAASPKTPRQAPADEVEADTDEQSQDAEAGADDDSGDTDASGRRRRRRGRRGRGRGKGGDDTAGDEQADTETSDASDTGADKAKDGQDDEDGSADSDSGEAAGETAGSRRRRRRRRRKGGDDDSGEGTTAEDPPNTVVHVRDAKEAKDAKDTKDSKADGKGEARDGVRSVRGSTRLEAKRQRRRDGREAGRRRAPILSESEFLARRESVARTMVVAERGESTQIGVLEDGVLVEHFVTTSGSGSIVGNVYLGRVQNVLPSMEAAFIDIGRGRNAVLYAGEVDWDAAGLEGKARKIEQALATGDNVLVQVTKDPVGHKGARLTTQISLPGRFLVYVPAGGATGISRKLPETERRRLKDILKRIVPEDAGVIIRTASEGISEEELERDVRRLKAQWEVIKEKSDSASTGGKKSGAPVLLYEEPDLLVKVVRDLFTEDFTKLEIQGDTAWETINAYVEHVAPDLSERLKRHTGKSDVFSEHRIDEQLTKALDRKVWLPSGGYLVIDRTEAMTVIDVNTGKFTGSGGNLEETVTRNNLESAEEIVRQLRLRDIGGIIVIDFIDMVLESNRELVLRRLTECLGRDRTRHQVAEVTSLGLVQMTRKRVGTGLLEAYSTTCEHCKGRGLIVSTEPQRPGGAGGNGGGGQQGGSRRSRGRGGRSEDTEPARTEPVSTGPTPEQRESVVSAVQAMANASKVAASKSDDTEDGDDTSTPAPAESAEPVEEQAESARPVNGHASAGETLSQPVEAGAEAPETSEISKTSETSGAPPSAAAEPEITPEARPEREQVPVPVPAARTAGRRPRRAASRPAGPPEHAQESPDDHPGERLDAGKQ